MNIQASQKVNPFGHTWGKPYRDGYATCIMCGCRENTKAASTDCPVRAPKETQG